MAAPYFSYDKINIKKTFPERNIEAAIADFLFCKRRCLASMLIPFVVNTINYSSKSYIQKKSCDFFLYFLDL